MSLLLRWHSYYVMLAMVMLILPSSTLRILPSMTATMEDRLVATLVSYKEA
jgi:hypothetical protein